jgi:hypothetical protein
MMLRMLNHLSQPIHLIDFRPYILNLGKRNKPITQIIELPILLIINKLQNRNPIIQLKRKAMDQIVNNNGAFQSKLFYHPQIFYMKPIMRLQTVIS